ncbi:protein-L-isoaspartate O-methyltransferase family protein [Candidatus Legionella polyplacis]|uniref:Protein-L-isoaspartate O-methyltransferase n=1 Tax=Candidatus Legionella polyplacis TaxID=2005262 RepID=A0ABZ2GXH9_9GAMM
MNKERNNMLKKQLYYGYITNKKILDIFNNIPRHIFVQNKFKTFSYSDMRIPINYGQYMLTPLEEAIILQSLFLKGNEKILEIGTGTGFFTAILSKLSKKIISIDYYEEFIKTAENKLKALSIRNIQLIKKDFNTYKCNNKYLFDILICTAAIDKIKIPYLLKFLSNGKLFTILKNKLTMKGILFIIQNNKIIKQNILFETITTPIIDHSNKKIFIL